MVKSGQDDLRRDSYVELMTRFRRVLVPGPGGDAAGTREAALRDFKIDTELKDRLNFDTFFKGVFQCVDLWAETPKEYDRLLRRLLQGVSQVRQTDGALVLKREDAVVFDEAFGVTSAYARAPGQQQGAERSRTFERLSPYLSRVLQVPTLRVFRSSSRLDRGDHLSSRPRPVNTFCDRSDRSKTQSWKVTVEAPVSHPGARPRGSSRRCRSRRTRRRSRSSRGASRAANGFGGASRPS